MTDAEKLRRRRRRQAERWGKTADGYLQTLPLCEDRATFERLQYWAINAVVKAAHYLHLSEDIG